MSTEEVRIDAGRLDDIDAIVDATAGRVHRDLDGGRRALIFNVAMRKPRQFGGLLLQESGLTSSPYFGIGE
jgi:hypothetical protein